MQDKYNTSHQIHWSWTPNTDSNTSNQDDAKPKGAREDIQDDDISSPDDDGADS